MARVTVLMTMVVVGVCIAEKTPGVDVVVFVVVEDVGLLVGVGRTVL